MAISQAIEFLRAALGAGPLSANDVRARAKAAGLSWASLRRAKQQLGIEAVRESEGSAGAGRWLWSLQKAQQDGQDAQPSVVPPQAAQSQAAQPRAVQLPAAQPPPRDAIVRADAARREAEAKGREIDGKLSRLNASLREIRREWESRP
jgi:hypothetical protein